jgi:hypothetical protein
MSSNDTCPPQLTTEAEASALFTTKLLEDIVEVAAVQDDIGVVGAEGGLADLQGSLVVGAGAGQIAPGRLVLQPVDRYLVGQGPGPAEQTRP